jgi:acyl-CoA synthetase (AMP-forming)/AMP-acid ligase II
VLLPPVDRPMRQMIDWTMMSKPMYMPQFTLDDYENVYADRHRLQDVVAKWAKAKPDSPAILSADGNRAVTWSEFDRDTTALAGELLRMGFAKGDFLVTMLPMTVDHVLLEYGCFKIGVIVAPLDLRLSAAEVIRALEILRPRGFAGLGVKAPFDFRELCRAVKAQCEWIEHFIVADSDEAIPGTQTFAAIAERANRSGTATLAEIAAGVTEDDGALVIFTTGSTGSPKPALLSHRNITVQNMCMCGTFFGGDCGPRTLVNLPPSHVGGQTEAMMSTLFGGGTAVLLEIFDASRSLRAVSQHRLEILGQIPVMFNLEWMLWRQCGVAAVCGPACRHVAGDRHRAGADRDCRFLHLYSGGCGWARDDSRRAGHGYADLSMHDSPADARRWQRRRRADLRRDWACVLQRAADFSGLCQRCRRHS